MKLIKSDCSTFCDAQQVICKQARDIFNSVLVQESSCRQLWLFHECSDICHVPVDFSPRCSALKNIQLWLMPWNWKWGTANHNTKMTTIRDTNGFLIYFIIETCSPLEHTDLENDHTNFDIDFYSFFSTVRKQCWRWPIQGKGSPYLCLPWLPQGCNQGTTKWASAGLPKSWNSSGKSNLAVSYFCSF